MSHETGPEADGVNRRDFLKTSLTAAAATAAVSVHAGAADADAGSGDKKEE